jgi:hypothetical protein
VREAAMSSQQQIAAALAIPLIGGLFIAANIWFR